MGAEKYPDLRFNFSNSLKLSHPYKSAQWIPFHFANVPYFPDVCRQKASCVWRRGVSKERRQLVIGGVCALGFLSLAANTEANAFILATHPPTQGCVGRVIGDVIVYRTERLTFSACHTDHRTPPLTRVTGRSVFPPYSPLRSGGPLSRNACHKWNKLAGSKVRRGFDGNAKLTAVL
ncbi:hypothetical protein NPIL_53511 [Nephila pilipes]|uniref:Uncharacterized protein n=1 Tax=Nephila pilipes TaxID=299642 RepID=A0A8X6PEH3_NEPPI|nr:hypothetical protein NPIL_53511 [Nephila pilipes]